jgi:hypothetical protein
MGTDMTETGVRSGASTTRKEKYLPGELRSIDTEQCESTMEARSKTEYRSNLPFSHVSMKPRR